MPVFTQRRGLIGAAGRIQNFRLAGGSDINLSTAVDSVTGKVFTDFNKSKKIIVHVEATCWGISASALTIPDLSNWYLIEIVVNAGVFIYGNAGAGGAGGNGVAGSVGGAGQPALSSYLVTKRQNYS